MKAYINKQEDWLNYHVITGASTCFERQITLENAVWLPDDPSDIAKDQVVPTNRRR